MATQIPTADSQKQYPLLNSATLALVVRAFMNRWFPTVTNTGPGLVIGTGSAAKVKFTNAVDYIKAGVLQTPIAANAEAVLSGDVIPISSAALFLIYINSSGTQVGIRGAEVAATATPEAPGVPAGGVPVGWCKVVTDATHTFTPGTTLLSAAGITDTYGDWMWPTSGPAALSETGSAGLQ